MMDWRDWFTVLHMDDDFNVVSVSNPYKDVYLEENGIKYSRKRVCPACCGPCKDRCYSVPGLGLVSPWWALRGEIRHSYNHLRPRPPFHGPRLPQAKDISDERILNILRAGKVRRVMIRQPNGTWEPGVVSEPARLSLTEVEEQLPGYPPKVVCAKLSALIRRGVIDGCACGCSGQFTVKR